MSATVPPVSPTHAAARRAGGGRARSRLLAVVVLFLAAVALRHSRPVTLPLVGGMFIVMLAWPLQTRLERRVPRPLAYTLTFLAVLVVLAAFITVLLWASRLVVEHLTNVQPRLEFIAAQGSDWLRRHGLPPLSVMAGGAGGGSTLATFAERAGRSLYESLTLLALTLGFALLGLVEVHSARERVLRRVPNGATLVTLVERVAGTLRRYVVVKTATSAITGLASTLLALALGLDLAFVWGLIAFLFEYVPTVGSTLAVIPPSLYAVVQFESLPRVLGVIGAFTALQLFFGNFVDPKIEGRVMAISPVVVLLSITLWAWIWGAPGALLGVPLTLVILIVFRHFERTRWVAALLSDQRERGGEPRHGGRGGDGDNGAGGSDRD